MAFRSMLLLRIVKRRYGNLNVRTCQNYASNSLDTREIKMNQYKEFKTEQNLKYIGDPDTFGTLSGNQNRKFNERLEDDGDIKEQKYLENVPLKSQKLTIKQYSDIIKQYLKHKRLKEAINVLEVKMLQEDRVKPENYIYNILIGACAEVGYTKKAFQLYNDMKKRALKPTGDTYTCLFEACVNSPWPADGLKNAKHLRNLMIEKGIEPNITNYNVMIKAFGRCGDIQTAFKIVDEMSSKKIKIRVHTFNHLLHACIADKENGLKYALMVWRKMLAMREKPNIYTFNLMLKCTKETNLGTKDDIQDLVASIQNQVFIHSNKRKMLQIGASDPNINLKNDENYQNRNISNCYIARDEENIFDKKEHNDTFNVEQSKEITVIENQNNHNPVTLLPKNYKLRSSTENRSVPNLLSKVLQLDQVLSLQEVQTLQEKFAVIGGQEDFLKEMEAYNIKPNIKIFTQMLPLIEENRESENKILETMESLQVKPDIDFFNMLIKKRCIRMDYEGAFLVKELIDKKNENSKKYLKHKKTLKSNILTYGVLAMACKTKENAEKLLNEMKEKQLKVNIEILGTLLRHGLTHNMFEYVFYIMDIVKEENLKPNENFLKHLEVFRNRCTNVDQIGHKSLHRGCKKFLNKYSEWLKNINITELKTEHPWKQFTETHPETVQRQNIQIKIPKTFYKRNRKYVHYFPKVQNID